MANVIKIKYKLKMNLKKAQNKLEEELRNVAEKTISLNI